MLRALLVGLFLVGCAGSESPAWVDDGMGDGGKTDAGATPSATVEPSALPSAEPDAGATPSATVEPSALPSAEPSVTGETDAVAPWTYEGPCTPVDSFLVSMQSVYSGLCDSGELDPVAPCELGKPCLTVIKDRVCYATRPASDACFGCYESLLDCECVQADPAMGSPDWFPGADAIKLPTSHVDCK